MGLGFLMNLYKIFYFYRRDDFTRLSNVKLSGFYFVFWFIPFIALLIYGNTFFYTTASLDCYETSETTNLYNTFKSTIYLGYLVMLSFILILTFIIMNMVAKAEVEEHGYY